MPKSIIFLGLSILIAASGQCQQTKQNKNGVSILVNLNQLSDSERLAFVREFKGYILSETSSASVKTVLPGETLGSLIYKAYGIKDTSPVYTEYVNRIASLNHIADKDHLVAGETIRLPAATYKPTIANHLHDFIQLPSDKAKLTANAKENLDRVANFAKANPGFHITLKSFSADVTNTESTTSLSSKVYSYLQKQGKIPAENIERQEVTGNASPDCTACNEIGIDAVRPVDIYNNNAATPQSWIGMPNLEYQLTDSRPANLELNVTSNDLAKIVSGKDKQFFFSLLNSNSVSVRLNAPLLAKINLCESPGQDIPWSFVPEQLDVDLSQLDTTDFGKYYIFDVFKKGQCLHGNKVYEVVKEVLSGYKLSNALNKVITVPINYFSNKEEGDSIYGAYLGLDGVGPLTNNVLWEGSPVDSATYAMDAGRDDITSEKYLSALNTLYINKAPSIISTSFTVACSANILTPSITNPFILQNTNFLAAANNDSSDIEKYAEPAGDSLGELGTFTEPLLSYMASSTKIGTIIVGDELSDTTYGGNYSQDGNNITSLGKGIGWGQQGSCIHLSDFGTSFATPEVAAQLFIAKAWWKKCNVRMNSLEARRRLILSSNLYPPFVGKFASAGVISLNKLLQTGNAYLVTNNDAIIPIDTVNMSFIDYTDMDQHAKNADFKVAGKRSLRGYYSTGGHYYIYNQNDGEKWIPISAVDDFGLTCRINGALTVVYKDDFPSKYKQLVILR